MLSISHWTSGIWSAQSIKHRSLVARRVMRRNQIGRISLRHSASLSLYLIEIGRRIQTACSRIGTIPSWFLESIGALREPD